VVGTLVVLACSWGQILQVEPSRALQEGPPGQVLPQDPHRVLPCLVAFQACPPLVGALPALHRKVQLQLL
jgi:hypothetical protein